MRALRITCALYVLVVLAAVLAPAPALETPARDVATSLSPKTPDPDPQPMQQVERVGWRRLDTLANLALFLPLGALVALAWPLTAATNLLGTAAFATGIELLQLTVVRQRSAQVRDVVVDTAGSVLGFAVARWWARRRAGSS